MDNFYFKSCIIFQKLINWFDSEIVPNSYFCFVLRNENLLFIRRCFGFPFSFFQSPYVSANAIYRRRHLSAADGTAYRELNFCVAGRGCCDVRLLTNEWVDGDANFAFCSLKMGNFIAPSTPSSERMLNHLIISWNCFLFSVYLFAFF